MAVNGSPRSVADATRFTANTPHAHTKARTPHSSTAPSVKTPSGSRTTTPPAAKTSAATSSTPRPESLDERVRRLRAAHLAARNHDVSKMDKVINASRRYMDAAHKYTVLGLIGFSGLALIVTAYATVDMMLYNRKRRNEFFALQKQLGADSLEAARLAYMTGTASDEQIAMVEDATAKAKAAGIAMPSLLATHPAAADSHSSGTERTVWPGEAMQESSLSGADEVEAPRRKGLKAWLFGGQRDGDNETGANDLSFSKAEAAASGRQNQLESTLGAQTEALKDKAKAAFDTERENQRKGGPLDKVGLDAEAKKKGWLW